MTHLAYQGQLITNPKNIANLLSEQFKSVSITPVKTSQPEEPDNHMPLLSLDSGLVYKQLRKLDQNK